MTESADPRAPLPAICTRCGTVFDSIYWVGEETQAFATSLGGGPCPNCGGKGKVPDRIWSVITRAFELARETEPTVADLSRMHGLVNEHLQGTIDLDVLNAQLQLQAPSAAPLLQIARDPATQRLLQLARDPAMQTLISLLGILIAIASLIVAMGGGPDDRPVPHREHHQHHRHGGQPPSSVEELGPEKDGRPDTDPPPPMEDRER